jgi:threonyl-tRNA synthetase
VVGEKEQTADTVAIRPRNGNQEISNLKNFIEKIKKEIENKII